MNIILADIFYSIPPILVLIFGIRVVLTRHVHRQIRIAWSILIIGFCLYIIGDFYSILIEMQTGEIPPFPSIPDYFFLAFYPVTMFGLLSFPFRPHTPSERIAFWLDVSMMMVGMAMVLWHISLQYIFESGHVTLLDLIVTLGYPGGDLVLLFGIIVILLRNPAYGSYKALLILALAFLILYITDIVYISQQNTDTYNIANYLDLNWAYVYFLITLSAYFQRKDGSHTQSDLPTTPEYSFKILPYTGVLFGYGLVIMMLTEQWAQPVAKLLSGAVLLTMIVITRQIIIIRENDKLRKTLEEKNTQLLELSLTDSLTGISNRRAFDARLGEEITRTHRYSEPLTLILVDVDHFKHYNDSYGHLAGDFVLQSIGLLLRQHARPIDMVARYGGEEFALLLPNTDLENGFIAAERLRYVIEHYDWPHRPITASFGVSSSTGPATEADKLQRQADAALYHAKIKRNDVQSLHEV